ncbi:hypothetical protein SDJN02_23413, partial [Cucurbita argyrosperma subsp. argyrosperma]
MNCSDLGGSGTAITGDRRSLPAISGRRRQPLESGKTISIEKGTRKILKVDIEIVIANADGEMVTNRSNIWSSTTTYGIPQRRLVQRSSVAGNFCPAPPKMGPKCLRGNPRHEELSRAPSIESRIIPPSGFEVSIFGFLVMLVIVQLHAC